MELIDRKQYTSKNLINKKYLISRNKKDNKIYYIFNLIDIQKEYPSKYYTEKQYYFCIPTDNRTKCYCYNDNLPIMVDWNDTIYQISNDEYLDLFRKFVKYDGQDKYDVNLNI